MKTGSSTTGENVTVKPRFTPEQQTWINSRIKQAIGVVKRLNNRGASSEEIDAAIAEFKASLFPSPSEWSKESV